MKTRLRIAITIIAFTCLACGTPAGSPRSDDVANASDPGPAATAEVILEPPPASSARPIASAAPVRSASTGSASSARVSEPCETYWAMSRRCNDAALKAMPEGAAKQDVRRQFDEAERQARESWQAFPGDALDNACKAMIDALASNPNCPK